MATPNISKTLTFRSRAPLFLSQAYSTIFEDLREDWSTFEYPTLLPKVGTMLIFTNNVDCICYSWRFIF
jgi:hypothetical protein